VPPQTRRPVAGLSWQVENSLTTYP